MSFLLRHGYAVLFVIVLVEQAGLPLPALPVLLAAGASTPSMTRAALARRPLSVSPWSSVRWI